MLEGTKIGGINCIIVNSEVEEIEMETNNTLDALIEINISTKGMINKVTRIYAGWKIINQSVKPLEYQIIRNEKPVILKTNAITYVARKQ